MMTVELFIPQDATLQAAMH